MILYLHGRGDEATDPPGDLVCAIDWPCPLQAPRLDEAWLARPYASRIREIDTRLDGAALAIGHSFGAWLLLCAAHERLSRGAPRPPLLLLSSVLGRGGTGELGFVTPWATRIRAALGLDEHQPGGQDLGGSGFGASDLAEQDRTETPAYPAGLLSFVHGQDDSQCPVADIEALSASYAVRILPGGHRLDHPEARAALRSDLHRWWRRLVEGSV